MALRTITADRDSLPSRDSVRQQHNLSVADGRYHRLNKLSQATIATLPACATATTASKAKTAAATTFLSNGVLIALAATDNFWVLSPTTVLAANMFRRYWLCANAAGTASVIASSDATTQAGCVFTALPADGVAIIATLTIATDATHPFTPATSLFTDTGITATFIDGIDDAAWLSAQVTP